MKLPLFLLALSLTSCASCQLQEDQAESPAALNQDRAITSLEGNVDVIQGTTDVEQSLLIRSYGDTTATISGSRECGYVTSVSSEELGWMAVPLKDLPAKEVCLYSVHVRSLGFDAPAVAHLFVRRFEDDNVLPMLTEMNGVERKGVNWVQLRQDQEVTSTGIGGILESRDITLKFSQTHTGKLIVTGCLLPTDVTEYENVSEISLTVDYLYRQFGKIDRSCLFTITANHDDALKESTTVFVKAYEGIGSFLDAPVVKETLGKRCFEFVDPYVVGAAANGKYSHSGSVCVEKTGSYVVEGVTSRFRTFYGEYSDAIGWMVMK